MLIDMAMNANTIQLRDNDRSRILSTGMKFQLKLRIMEA